LRVLIQHRQQQAARLEEATNLKYYEETMKDTKRPAAEESDDWTFDTVKPGTVMPMPAQQETIRKSKLSEVATPTLEPPIDMMESMVIKNDIPPKDDPYLDDMDQPATVRLAQRQPSTTRLASPVKQNIPAPPPRSPTKPASPVKSMITATPTGSPKRTPSRIGSPASKLAPLSRSPSKRTASAISPLKQPLGVDTSFGNGNSSQRQFRRVSEEAMEIKQDENEHPAAEYATKEGRLGKRLFAKVIDPACQEVYAKTAEQAKLETISKVNQAWAALDALDPEGELLLFKSMLEKVQRYEKSVSHWYVSVLTQLQRSTIITTPDSQIRLIFLTSTYILSSRLTNPHALDTITKPFKSKTSSKFQTRPRTGKSSSQIRTSTAGLCSTLCCEWNVRRRWR